MLSVIQSRCEPDKARNGYEKGLPRQHGNVMKRVVWGSHWKKTGKMLGSASSPAKARATLQMCMAFVGYLRVQLPAHNHCVSLEFTESVLWKVRNQNDATPGSRVMTDI
jgi:hypothetical protein